MKVPKIEPAVAGGIVVEILVNFVLPYAIFACDQPRGGDVRALLWSSAPPIVWSIVELVRNRRFDAFSLLVIAGIALGLLAFAGGGSVKFLQLRENLVTGLIGAAFLISAAIGRPLIYQLALAMSRRQSVAKAAEFSQLQAYGGFRRTMTVMTIVWGIGLLLSAAVACALVFALSIRQYLIAGPIVGYAFIGILALWTFLYARRQRRRRLGPTSE